jgi:hypothetical protein
MTEILLRDRLELEKQRDKLAEVNRIASIESAVAVIRTIIDAHLKTYAETGISAEDLKALKQEMEAELNQQMREIVGEFKSILTAEQLAQSNALLKANAETRKEILRYGIGFALTIISALVIFYLTRNG